MVRDFSSRLKNFDEGIGRKSLDIFNRDALGEYHVTGGYA
jgi:hypothetical protein